MNTLRWIAVISSMLWATLALAEPFGTAFTYQGQLQQQGQQADGEFDFSFALFDVELGGTEVTTTIELENLVVTDGTFTVELDFGAVIQAEDEYWLEIGVRPGSSVDSHTLLAPRQYLYPGPRSIFTLRAATSAQSDLADNADALQGHPAADFSLAAHDHGDQFWKLSGNAGTTGASFVGTTDNQALELRVNAFRALRLEPDTTSPNVLGGYGGNAAAGGTSGGTISGGGRDLAINQVTGDFGTVGGGAGNMASGYAATIGGGEEQTASGSYATVGGGQQNSAADHAVAGGGENNQANGAHATVSGGGTNNASGDFSAIGGGLANQAGGNLATVAGGSNNSAQAKYAAIAGGGPTDEGNPTTTNNRVSDDYGAVGGGGGNRAGDGAGTTADATYASVAGGRQNTASGTYSAVGGGDSNVAGGYAATVAGGNANSTNDNYATVSGGLGNSAGNQYATVSGGRMNAAVSPYSSVAGGFTNNASNTFATVSGGATNTASGAYATVPGGQENTAAGQGSFAAGYRASADHAGAFVWADSSADMFSSTGNDQFLVSAAGGVGIGTDTPKEMLTVKGNVLVSGEDDPVFRGSVSPDDPDSGNRMDAPSALQAVDSMVFVSSYSFNLLHVIDASDPGNMVEIGLSSSNLSGPLSLHVLGQRAYIASQLNDQLVIMDLSDLSAPQSIGSNFTTDNPTAIFVSGRYAYLVARGSTTPPTSSALEIHDISDPANIILKDGISTNLDNPSDVYISGSYAYVSSRDNNLFAIFDISNPNAIVARGTTSDLVNGPHSIHISENVAIMIMEDSNSLVAYDVANPDDIVTLGSISENLSAPRDVYISGSYAYVASFGNDRLAVFDVSDPANMIAMGYSSSGLDGPVAVFVAGQRVYVASQTNDSLVAFDINHLETPAIQTGSIQASQIDVTDYARVNHLDVASGLNVGLGGAMINGGVAVDGVMAPAADDSHSLGEAGKRWTEVHAVNGVIQTSDGRLKDNVKPLPYGLAELARLEPVAFSWTDGDPDDRHLGLVAQQVAEVLPELVHQGNNLDGTLGLNYGELVPVLINAVKELRGEISNQAVVIETLQDRLDALENSSSGGG